MIWIIDKKPEELYRAFYNLRDNTSFQYIVAWLKAAKENEAGIFPGIDADVSVRQCQGRMQALDAILTTNGMAGTMLNKLAKPV